MDIHTISALNQLNADFYTTTAKEFDTTRNHIWPGWETLLTHIEPSTTKTILDLGCGNGRFGAFAFENFDYLTHYTGIDSNPTLLEAARKTLSPQKEKVTLNQENILETLLTNKLLSFDSQTFDLITVFGVMHHIPSTQLRKIFLKKLASRLNPGGQLVFTTWNFIEFERFTDRLIAPTKLKIDTNQLENNDYFLDWRRGEQAIRYCHAYTTEEVADLLKGTPLQLVTTYRADGRENEVNTYYVTTLKAPKERVE